MRKIKIFKCDADSIESEINGWVEDNNIYVVSISAVQTHSVHYPITYVLYEEKYINEDAMERMFAIDDEGPHAIKGPFVMRKSKNISTDDDLAK